MKAFLVFLEARPKYQIVILCSILVVFFAVVDYITGPDLSVFIFYLIPVFIATWLLGNRAGILFSLLSASVWSLSDILSFRVYSHAIIPYWNLLTELLFFLIVVYLLVVLKAALEQEKKIARTDFLTGAVNSRYFQEVAETEINRADRYKHRFTAVYFDVDNFKAINDTYGHATGDALLKESVRTIREHIRISDTVARLGGDEFALLFPETDFDTARAVLDKLRRKLVEVMEQQGWNVTFSFGMVTFNEPPDSVHQIVKLTDELMYQAKKQGKNGVVHTEYGILKTK